MRRHTASTRLAAVVFAATLALTAAGCGQKAGVNQMYGGAGGTAAGGVPGTTDSLGGVAGGDGLSGGSGDLSGGSGSGDLSSDSGSLDSDGDGIPDEKDKDPGTPSPPPSAPPAGPGDRTGVTDTTIKIGVHAPVTGAAAIPQASFERAVGVYFDSVNRNGGIHGRKVEVLFEDDGFDPTKARGVCKAMAEQEEVFMLIGGAGADQIDACARYAAASSIPYVSGGVHETRPQLGSLGSLSTYFAISMTYEQQIALLGRLLKTQFGGDKVAVIVADNDTLDNFYAKAASAAKSVAGDDLVLSRRIPKNTSSDAPAVATNICNSGAQVVLWNASPSSLINVAQSMTCTVKFIGPGLSNGLNIVTSAGCPKLAGSLFYSPFPGMDVMRKNSAFVSAYRNKNGAEPDDIGAAIYGLEKVVGAMLDATGKDLTRESFMATIARVKRFETGVFPPTGFSSRFGGTAMHLLQADCGKREWVTARQNERP